MSLVFVNYRTGDAENDAAFLELELSHRFGRHQVFRAARAIRPGQNWEREILTAVRRSDALLAVIGPNWLAPAYPYGPPALADPAHWTSREITEAFAADSRVIPVLVDEAPRPSRGLLPRHLAPIAGCQYVRLHHRSLDRDVARLAGELALLVPGLDAPRPHQSAPLAPIQVAHGRGRNYAAGRDLNITP